MPVIILMIGLAVAAMTGIHRASAFNWVEADAPVVHMVGYGDIGGDTDEYFDKYERWANADEPVEIHGTCMSACALALLWTNGCVAPDARVGYHQGYFIDGQGRYVAPSRAATKLQYEAMPPRARDLRLPLGNSGRMVWLRYKDFPPDYRC